MKRELIKAYVESFGWRIEDCSEQELKEVEKELEDLSKGRIILDSVLSKKTIVPSNK